ncbi:DUF2029 domain-containing protein [Bradyrhizobium sp. Arg68]|uniref:glycosyltransferase family 87 protein n=1 Tax=Bradyrhizobium ivorense TaxID=2511166 RepID=UPI0027E27B88|nr:glycosyltransferase family 87 protein [Bradyrhizobium ivorense]MCC8939901.1 DUF2029 domain-containing protein [Bradyrhizobium ivorense]
MKYFALHAPATGATQDALGTASGQVKWARLILAGLAIVLMLMTWWLFGWQFGQSRPLIDFDAFYIVAKSVWLGDLDQVYHLDKFKKLQIDAVGGSVNQLGHWTYPPQFDLLIAPLGLVHVGTAYFLFIATTLGLYLGTLRAISKDCFALVVILLSPALLLTLIGGQNGFLTGSLAGLTCVAIERKRLVAGCSLGLMVIKPHLAAGVAIYALLARRWITVITAIGIIISSSILCTLLFGVQIWSSFLSSAQDLSAYYGSGRFDLYRSISFYAVLRSAGFPAALALVGQAVVALAALSVVALAIYRELPARRSLGIAAIASLLTSPYAYDYDLPILGVGMALLLPDLKHLATSLERRAIFGLTFTAGFYGAFQIVRLLIQDEKRSIDQPAIGGLVLAALLCLILRVSLRANERSRLGASNVE